MTCIAPALRINATDVRIGLLMDNVTELLDVNVTLTLYPDPSFATRPTDELRPGDNKNLTLESVKVRCISCDYLSIVKWLFL